MRRAARRPRGTNSRQRRRGSGRGRRAGLGSGGGGGGGEGGGACAPATVGSGGGRERAVLDDIPSERDDLGEHLGQDDRVGGCADEAGEDVGDPVLGGLDAEPLGQADQALLAADLVIEIAATRQAVGDLAVGSADLAVVVAVNPSPELRAIDQGHLGTSMVGGDLAKTARSTATAIPCGRV